MVEFRVEILTVKKGKEGTTVNEYKSNLLDDLNKQRPIETEVTPPTNINLKLPNQ